MRLVGVITNIVKSLMAEHARKRDLRLKLEALIDPTFLSRATKGLT